MVYVLDVPEKTKMRSYVLDENSWLPLSDAVT